MDSKETNVNMKMVGVIGGLSHESSDSYSEGVHNIVNRKLGGLHNAHYVQRDVDFHEIRQDMLSGKWDDIGYFMGTLAKALIDFGADYVAMASNTIHKIAPEVEAFIGRERFIHIADCVGWRCAEEIEANREQHPQYYDDDVRRVLLLGTKETMVGDFIKQHLEDYDLTVVVPSLSDMEELDAKIFNELCHGVINRQTRNWFSFILKDILSRRPIDAIVLGCTELSLLHSASELANTLELLQANGDRPLTVVDSKEAHIQGIAEACLGQWKVPTIESEL